LKQDFKYVARQLRRGPGFAAAVIVTLAVGIGFGARVANVPLGVALMAGAFGAPLLGHWLKSLAFGISRFRRSSGGRCGRCAYRWPARRVVTGAARRPHRATDQSRKESSL
jgi:hypothetical protein